MLSIKREHYILELVSSQGAVTVRELAHLLNVTEVTIRRDLQRMEARELLRRTHGGAVLPDFSSDVAPVARPGPDHEQTNGVDALIIAPVNNRVAHTLREKAIRNQVPFLAESSPQDNAIYLGPRNFEAGYELGVWTGRTIEASSIAEPVVLDITQPAHANTLQRSQGFTAGLRSVLGDSVPVVSVDGKALYDQSYQIAVDAIRTNPRFNVIFGINDDSVLAGIQAAEDSGLNSDNLLAVNVGGEGSTIFAELSSRSPFRACMALFPEVVGRMGIDSICYLWAGQAIGDVIYTPHRLLTAETLSQYYVRDRTHWHLRDSVISELVDEHWLDDPPPHPDKRVSFVIHYRTHEWYQNVAQAMAARAQLLGVNFSVHDLEDDIAAEIRDLRRLIGKLAASHIQEGDTVILDAGSTTAYMAQFLANYKNLTVITNSLDVLTRLKGRNNIQIILTGGEYDAVANCLVGRGSQLVLDEMRADKAFVVAGGISTDFGVSCLNVREAEVRRQMMASARQTIVLADHTVIGQDANVRICDLNRISALITDAGIQAEHRLGFSRMGIDVIVAGHIFHRSGGSVPDVGASGFHTTGSA